MSNRRAFTVLELVVVIGIILILMALALTVTSSVLAANDRRTVENTFRLLEQAIESWQAQMGREMTFGRRIMPGGSGTPDYTGTAPTVAYDVYELNFPTVHAICIILDRLSVPGSESAEILSRMPATSLRFVPMNGATVVGDPLPAAGAWAPNPMTTACNPGTTTINLALVKEIVDPWGKRIATSYPGRAATRAELADPSVLTDPQDGTVRTLDEQSMGICRNKRPFFVSAGPDGDFNTTADNIYSYEPLPRP